MCSFSFAYNTEVLNVAC